MSASLVGSEMCIRDSLLEIPPPGAWSPRAPGEGASQAPRRGARPAPAEAQHESAPAGPPPSGAARRAS
eukprot:6783437-Alexandrium_andersonii.AAC.1